MLNFLFFHNFLLLTPIAETESSANRGVELPQNRRVCPGCVISLIRAATLFSMKLKSSIAAFVFMPGVACGVMFNVPTIFNVFTQECGTSYNKVFRKLHLGSFFFFFDQISLMVNEFLIVLYDRLMSVGSNQLSIN